MASTLSEDLRTREPTFQKTNDVYLLPNDVQEHERLQDMHEALVALSKDQVVMAPIDKSSIKTIVDVGCGAGATTRELRARFPEAHRVYGVDLSKVSAAPEDEEKEGLPHLEFIEGDIMKLAGTDSRLEPGSVDLVWSRLLICGLTDWPGYVSRAFELLKPGCWAQMSDWTEDVYFDHSLSDRPRGFVAAHQWEWLRAIREGGVQKGLDVDAGLNIPRYMREAGFVDVKLTEIRVPYWRGALETRPEAKKAFEHWTGDNFALFWHMIPRITENLGYSSEKVKQLQLDSRRDLGEERGKYQTFFVTTGRKPGHKLK